MVSFGAYCLGTGAQNTVKNGTSAQVIEKDNYDLLSSPIRFIAFLVVVLLVVMVAAYLYTMAIIRSV